MKPVETLCWINKVKYWRLFLFLAAACIQSQLVYANTKVTSVQTAKCMEIQKDVGKLCSHCPKDPVIDYS